MDVRMAVCDLIVRDAVLRALLLNRPDRTEPGRSRDGEGAEACSLVLEWTGEDPGQSPTAVQWLTARVQLPRCPSGDRVLLDVVLHRLRTVVSTPGTAFTARCLGTSPALVDCRDRTASKVATYEFTPAPRREPRAQLVPGRRERPIAATAFGIPGATSPNLN